MKKYVSEFLGTLVLVLFACGTAALVQVNGAEANTAYLLTALSFGLAFIAVYYIIGSISGCHINPAVSLAMKITGKMDSKEFWSYFLAQLLGSITGAALLVYLLGTESGLGANMLYQNNTIKTIIIEMILTFVFVLTVLAVSSKPELSNLAGIIIGLSLTLVHIFGIGFTGTSVNPARSFGPALLVGGQALSSVWVFFVGPFLGACIASCVWKSLTKADK